MFANIDQGGLRGWNTVNIYNPPPVLLSWDKLSSDY